VTFPIPFRPPFAAAGGGGDPLGGGTLTTDGDYQIRTFTSSGSLTVTTDTYVDLLMAAGGGGGGAGIGTTGSGGGGGGGELVLASMLLTAAGSPYTVNVGTGGAGSTANSVKGTSGGNSTFNGLTAIGGGGGGSAGAVAGVSGGSGGGGAGQSGAGGASTASDGYGNAGGASGLYTGGGGGGAGAAAPTSPASHPAIGGAGGDGLSSNITGTLTIYAGGGAGGSSSHATAGIADTSAGDGGSVGNPDGYDAPANLGGGGGGGLNDSSIDGDGGAGGDGVVIVRYKTDATAAFEPADLQNVHYWWRADDTSTMFTDTGGTTAVTTNGDAVDSWKCYWTATALTNATGGTYQTGSPAHVDFNSADLQGTPDFTVFDDASLFLNVRVPVDENVAFVYNTSSRFLFVGNSGNGTAQVGTNHFNGELVSPNTWGGFYTEAMADNTSFGAAAVDGVDLSVWTGFEIGGLYPNAAYYSNVEFSDLLIAPKGLSLFDRTKLEGYFAHRDGYEGNLPVSHPFVSAAPKRYDASRAFLISANSLGSGANPTLDLTGAQTGDLAIAVSLANDTTQSMSVAGWSTSAQSHAGGASNARLEAWYKVLTAGDISSPATINVSASYQAAIVVILRGPTSFSLKQNAAGDSAGLSFSLPGFTKDVSSLGGLLLLGDTTTGQTGLSVGADSWTAQFNSVVTTFRFMGVATIPAADYTNNADIDVTYTGGGSGASTRYLVLELL
jgi:hypothetical protein